jgi:hypothetical protein
MLQVFRVCRWIFLTGLVSATSLAEEELNLPLQLSVAVGQQSRTDAIVVFRMAALKKAQPPLRLVETTSGKEIPVAVQLDSQDACLWWVASGLTSAGTKRMYRLESGPSAAVPDIAVIDSERAVEVTFDSKPLLQYNKAHVEPPSGVDPKYGRSAHLHPIRTPSGAVVTEEFPSDHLHQSGIFLAFTKTEFEGRPVDFWNLAGGKGRVRFKNLRGTTSGPVFGRLRVEHDHVDLSSADGAPGDGIRTGGKVALVETWDVRIWNAGWKSGYWLLDIKSQVTCAGESPLRLPEYHYGGLAIRAAQGWTPQHVTFLTSEGADRLKGNHTRPRWCDVRGAINERMAGVTFMTHPNNFRFPEPLRIHPTMPYMVYTPAFLGGWEIRPGIPHESRYRFVIRDGELPGEAIERLWSDYAEPLTATAG